MLNGRRRTGVYDSPVERRKVFSPEPTSIKNKRGILDSLYPLYSLYYVYRVKKVGVKLSIASIVSIVSTQVASRLHQRTEIDHQKIPVLYLDTKTI